MSKNADLKMEVRPEVHVHLTVVGSAEPSEIARAVKQILDPPVEPVVQREPVAFMVKDPESPTPYMGLMPGQWHADKAAALRFVSVPDALAFLQRNRPDVFRWVEHDMVKIVPIFAAPQPVLH